MTIYFSLFFILARLDRIEKSEQGVQYCFTEAVGSLGEFSLILLGWFSRRQQWFSRTAHVRHVLYTSTMGHPQKFTSFYTSDVGYKAEGVKSMYIVVMDN
jgi:hypothetical protein